MKLRRVCEILASATKLGRELRHSVLQRRFDATTNRGVVCVRLLDIADTPFALHTVPSTTLRFDTQSIFSYDRLWPEWADAFGDKDLPGQLNMAQRPTSPASPLRPRASANRTTSRCPPVNRLQRNDDRKLGIGTHPPQA